MAKKHKKASIIKTITEYGIHIWAILIIANAALVYAFNFAAHASNDKTQFLASGKEEQAQDNPSDTNSLTPTKDPKKVGGPKLDLAFAVPGIGSGGGTLKPINLKRDVTVYLFSTDTNSMNPSVKPLFTIKGTATFDDNTNSPTYTAFVNNALDLGTDVPDGTYQVAFRTNQSARTLIRESKDSLGGLKISLRQNVKADPLPLQSVNMGDILPEEGDNVIDISDYNAFVNCYNNRKQSDFCRGRTYGDFDDNGIVDGIDYNIMLRSFGNLLEQGQSVPQITVAPSRPDRVAVLSSPTPVKEKSASPASKKPVAQTQSSKSGGGMIGGLLFFIFLVILAAIGFVLYKKNEKVHMMIRSIIHRSPTGIPSEATKPDQQNQAAPIIEGSDPSSPATVPTDQAQPESGITKVTNPQPQDSQPIEETQPALSDQPPMPTPDTNQPTQPPASAITSTPIQSAVNQAPPLPSAPPILQPSTSIPSSISQPEINQPTAPTTGQEVEKDVYVKVKEPDTAGTGQWLLLSDDNGPVKGHYAKNDAKDGFAKVKGVMKTENGTTFMEVSELIAE